MSAVQRFCERSLLISKGKIEYIGNPNEVADRYLEQNLNAPKVKKKDGLEFQHDFKISEVELVGASGTRSLSLNDEITINAKVANSGKRSKLRLGVQVFSATGVYCYGTNTKVGGMPTFSNENTSVRIKLKQVLLPGTYHVTMAIMDEAANKVLHYAPKVATFNVKQQTEVQGVSDMQAEWEIASV